MRVSFNWLKDYVNIRLSPEQVAEKLTIIGLEVTSLAKFDEDTIFEIEVTPNRPDCLSMIGIAREVAAIMDKRLKVPHISSFRGKAHLSIPILIRDKKLCSKYLGRVIRNIQVGPSPQWLIQRLEVMGIRAVNNIVDITNFCLLEFGQPLHAFDLDKLEGQSIIVRPALKGEHIVTIDGVRRSLDPSVLVIADKYKPQAIAGIMGAKDSEVGDETTNILLESAYFNPLNIHNTSRKLGLATQSSYRFERGVDLEGVYLGSLRAAELISRLACPSRKIKVMHRGKKTENMIMGKLVNKGVKVSQRIKVRLRYIKVNQLLGVELSPVQIVAILRSLAFSVVRRTKDSLTVNVPSFRNDITREVDLIEEISRIYGYDKIPLSFSRLSPSFQDAGRLELTSQTVYNLVRDHLSCLGLHEIMTYSLISRQALRKLELPVEDIITVKNPLSYEQEILRPTLLVGMLNALLTNINRKSTNLKLFELSRVYLKQAPHSIKECTNLCIGIAGRKRDNWMQKSDEYCFFDAKGIVEALLSKLGIKDVHFDEPVEPLDIFVSGRAAVLTQGQTHFGFLGQIKRAILERFDLPCAVYVCELKLYKLLAHICQEKRFVPLARFPSVERDISLIVSQEIRSEQIATVIKKIGRDLVEKVTLFDQYYGEQIPSGSRGLAYSIVYRSNKKTLTTEEVDSLHEQVRRALSAELNVQLR
jgi:phenylalanyl-tRNA synthetase beta chain